MVMHSTVAAGNDTLSTERRKEKSNEGGREREGRTPRGEKNKLEES